MGWYTRLPASQRECKAIVRGNNGRFVETSSPTDYNDAGGNIEWNSQINDRSITHTRSTELHSCIHPIHACILSILCMHPSYAYIHPMHTSTTCTSHPHYKKRKKKRTKTKRKKKQLAKHKMENRKRVLMFCPSVDWWIFRFRFGFSANLS